MEAGWNLERFSPAASVSRCRRAPGAGTCPRQGRDGKQQSLLVILPAEMTAPTRRRYSTSASTGNSAATSFP